MKNETRYPFEVYNTEFHGGRFVSRHATEAAAWKAVKRQKMDGCWCGCAGVIDSRDEVLNNKGSYSSPYSVSA